MIELKKTPEHTVDRIFILVLLTMFAAIAFLLVFTGARQYHSIADGMTTNYESRTIASYLREKMNQSDVQGQVSLSSVGDCAALALREKANDAVYITYIYSFDGYLYEITVLDGTEVSEGDGQKVMEVKGLDMEMLNSQLYEFKVTDASDSTYTMYISLNTKQ